MRIVPFPKVGFSIRLPEIVNKHKIQDENKDLQLNFILLTSGMLNLT